MAILAPIWTPSTRSSSWNSWICRRWRKRRPSVTSGGKSWLRPGPATPGIGRSAWRCVFTDWAEKTGRSRAPGKSAVGRPHPGDSDQRHRPGQRQRRGFLSDGTGDQGAIALRSYPVLGVLQRPLSPTCPVPKTIPKAAGVFTSAYAVPDLLVQSYSMPVAFRPDAEQTVVEKVSKLIRQLA